LNANITGAGRRAEAVAASWLEVLGGFAGLSATVIAGLIEAHGSFSEDLRRSLIAHSHFPPGSSPSIAIIHGESQSTLTELVSFREHFEKQGHRAMLAKPSQIHLAQDRSVVIEGMSWDLLYCQIPSTDIPPGSALETVALGDSPNRLQNEIRTYLSLKGALAEIKRLADEEPMILGLNAAEQDTLNRTVPWTRLLLDEPGTSPDGKYCESLVEMVNHMGERLVLKPSLGHGGQGVVIGPEVIKASGQASWRSILSQAVNDVPGAWVLQEFVPSPLQRHLVVSGESIESMSVFVDASTYTASGTRSVPRGGMARFAPTGVVNISGGGGLAPLILESVASPVKAALLARLEA
jgi:hypothetical protein